MRRSLVVITEIISPYRIPVFNALARHPDVDLHVIFLAETDPVLRQWEIAKDQIRFPYEVLRSSRLRFGGHQLLLNFGLGEALRAAAPEAIICGGYNYPASWQAWRWSHRHKARFVAWIESTQMDQRGGHALVEFLKRRFVGACDGFVVPGVSSFEYVRSFHVPGDSIFTAPNAVDTDFFASHAELVREEAAKYRKDLGLSKRYFLFVGRLVREKGVFDLLAAYAEMAAELRGEVDLVFVGDGNARATLEQRAREILPGCVHFPGFAQRERLGAYYALADALFLPTYSDTWGLVVNESMACGLPVVCSDVAGCVADLVKDGWNGRVVRAKDVGSLVTAMTELAVHEDVAHRMGQNSLDQIRGYSPQACAAGMALAAFPLQGTVHG